MCHRFFESDVTKDKSTYIPMKKKPCHSPNLNTQSYIKGLLVVRDFCFWVVWAAGPAHKKSWEPHYEQLLRAVFSFLQVQKIFKKYTASELKSCIINFKYIYIFLNKKKNSLE